MAKYPPPPDVDAHFTTVYPNQPVSGDSHALETSIHELRYPELTHAILPKREITLEKSGTPPVRHVHLELQHPTLQVETQTSSLVDERQRPNQMTVSNQPDDILSMSHIPAGVDDYTSSTQMSTSDGHKANRLRKACDSCSIRKVKCDETGPPCRACASLDIPCTFDRPSRRRGPPNRHAEAIKRRRLDEHQAGEAQLYPGRSSPSSPSRAAEALAALSSVNSEADVSAESICPIDTLNLLIDDFFTYIHPLCPFPHEPSFREAWKRREDTSNRSFLALLASMIGALVSSFPRKPRLHLKRHQQDHLFPTHISLVHRCQQICGLARGPGYLENPNLNVYDAATSYFLALMGTYTFRWRLGRLYFGECLTIIRTLGLYKSRDETHIPSAVESMTARHNVQATDTARDQRVDNITLEMSRRIFWTMFVSIKTLQQLGASFGELFIPPSTVSEPYPPLPAEVDDFCIFPTHNEPQPAGLLPIISGFNANVRVFGSYNHLSAIELAWGVDVISDWSRQERILCESLKRCNFAIADLPNELKVLSGHVLFDSARPADASVGSSHEVTATWNDGVTSSNQTPGQSEDEQSPHDRRKMQYEIQKANVYASSLSTRSYIVEKYFNLCDARDRTTQALHTPADSPERADGSEGIREQMRHASSPQCARSVDEEMRQERESIIKDLLVVLSSINQVNMEPNADSFTMKIRSIASTLLDVPAGRKGQLAIQAQEYLAAFLEILTKLEHASSSRTRSGQADVEEAELRSWSDLREYQLKFAQEGGLVGMS